MNKETIEIFYPTSRKHWRQWLQRHHNKKQSVWIVYYKKGSDMPTISWSEAVDEALCFGWIDSQKKSIDDEKFMQYFSRRKTNSAWSRINKSKIKRLTDDGLMTKAGIDCIETAKQNGSWTILDKIEEHVIPKDLEKEFRKNPGSKIYFSSLSKSDKRNILQWLVLARRDETRKKRVNEIAELAAQKLKPKQFR
jgi:uncharacterized protein YdeI (YjbR/CyaY-like superfamily)